MPSPEFNVLPSVSRSVRYTGTNSADLLAQIPNVSFISEADGFLVLQHQEGRVMQLAVNDWVIWNSAQTFEMPNTLYFREWGCVGLCSDINAANARISDLEARVEALEA